VVFAVVTVGRLGQTDEHDALVLFSIGIGLILIGVAGFFVARWMAKRHL
jgi:hypothetical protein